eukprot:g5304.t1
MILQTCGRVGLAKMLKEVWQSKTDRDISNVSVDHCAPHCLQLACNKAFKSNSSVKTDSLKWNCELFGIGGTVKKQRLAGSLEMLAYPACAKRYQRFEKTWGTSLQKKLGTFEFQATLWFLSDVLPILTTFSTSLQATKADISIVVDAYEQCSNTFRGFSQSIDGMTFMKKFSRFMRGRKLEFSDLDSEGKVAAAEYEQKVGTAVKIRTASEETIP